MGLRLLFTAAIVLVSSAMRSQSFDLAVSGGYGSGTYEEGDTVHIWANAVFNDTVFTEWTGSGRRYLTFNNEWHTTLIVPSGTGVGHLTISANSDVVPSSTQMASIGYSLYGKKAGVVANVRKEVFYASPRSPKGLVFLFHGANGNGRSYFSKYERYTLVKDLVKAGYAVFALDANERTMGDQNGDGKISWDNANAGLASATNNVDILNIKTLRDSVIRTFSFSKDIPTFTVGVSAGAVFSDICASVLGYKASAHVTARGRKDTYTRPGAAPVIWIMAENDHNRSADNATAYRNYLTLKAVQTAEWHWFKRSPVYPGRFVRSLNNISNPQSERIFQRLRTNGYLDSAYFLTVLDLNQLPVSLLDNLGLTKGQKNDIHQQLLCVNADHVLHSDYNKNIIRFFNHMISPLSTDERDVESTGTTRIYPNPNTGQLKVGIEANYSQLRVSLYTKTGERILSAENQTDIDLRPLPNGTYYITVEIDGKAETFKTIKIK